MRPGGTPVELPEILVQTHGERVRFLPDGSGLVYVKGIGPTRAFHLLDLETSGPRQLTRLDTPRTMRTFDISPDGTRIIFDRLKEESDIVLIERNTSASTP